MPAAVVLAFLALSLAALACLTALLVAAKLSRTHAERTVAARRDRYGRALRRAPPAELRRVARQACRSMAAQDDLARAFAAEIPALPRARRRALEQAFREGRLERSLLRALRSRRAMRRSRAVLLAGPIVTIPLAALEPLLHDGDADVRLAAVRAIGQRASPEAARALIAALREGALPAERIVERLAARWALEPILDSIARPELRPTRGWLAEALGLIRDPRGEPALVRLLADGDMDERARAGRALGRIGLRRSVPVLIAALSDPEAAVRAQAARSLEAIPAERAMPALVAALADSSWWVRANCARALRQLGPHGIAALELCAGSHRDRYARQRAAEALALAADTRTAA